MRNEDLKIFAEIGGALWPDSTRSRRIALETFSAVSLLDLTPERHLERASAALLAQALRDGIGAIASHDLNTPGILNQHFFRLEPEERFVLAGLHLGRWSYARIARIMRVEPEKVEELAWSARLKLAARAYPGGPSAPGPSCPPYDSRRPWTQRFLDEEFSSGAQRLFMQNHLMACDKCRTALSRCRDLYYGVDQALPKSLEPEEENDLVRHLEKLARKSAPLDSATQVFRRSLEVFFKRTDIRVFLAVGAALLIWSWVR